MGLRFITIVCRLQLTYAVNRCFAAGTDIMHFSNTCDYVILNISFDGEWKVLGLSTSDTFLYTPNLLSFVIQSN